MKIRNTEECVKRVLKWCDVEELKELVVEENDVEEFEKHI